MNNTNIAFFFSQFVCMTITIPTKYLDIVNIVGNVLTIPSDALLQLQIICVPLVLETHSHFINKQINLIVKIYFYQQKILFVARFLLLQVPFFVVDMWLLMLLLPEIVLVLRSREILTQHVVAHPITLFIFSPGLHYNK